MMMIIIIITTVVVVVVVVVVDGFCVHNLSALTRSPLLSAGVGGYHVRSKRNVNMPPHPTPPQPVRFTGTVFGPQAETCR